MSSVPAFPFECFASTPRHSKPCNILVLGFEGYSLLYCYELDEDVEEYELAPYSQEVIWASFVSDMGIKF